MTARTSLRHTRVSRLLSALHLSIIVLATFAGVSHAHAPEGWAHVARQASLTPPTVGLTDSTSSGSLTGSVSILPIATTTTALTTSIGPSGTSTFLTTITTLVGPGPSNTSTESGSNTSATSTSTAFPSLSSYSACVDNCLQTAVSASNCSSVTEPACYCVSSIFPASLVQCVTDSCADELSTAEGLAQAFCNLSSATVSLAFPAPSVTSSALSSADATSTSASASASASGNAGTSLRLGLTQGDVWGSRMGLLTLVGIGVGAGSLIC